MAEVRRKEDRRAGGRGGRRLGDQRLPWWRKGLVFAAICGVLKCWRYVRR
jgi:hypothetical protein